MKPFFLLVVVFLFGANVNAQIQDPVNWSYTVIKINTATYEVHLTANIDAGWHLYSQKTPKGGPVPTTIKFSKNPLLVISGVPKEVGKMEQHHEALFGVDVKQYSGKVDFVQRVVVKGKVKTSLNGTIEYMTCNDEECLPPKSQKFSITLR